VRLRRGRPSFQSQHRRVGRTAGPGLVNIVVLHSCLDQRAANDLDCGPAPPRFAPAHGKATRSADGTIACGITSGNATWRRADRARAVAVTTAAAVTMAAAVMEKTAREQIERLLLAGMRDNVHSDLSPRPGSPCLRQATFCTRNNMAPRPGDGGIEENNDRVPKLRRRSRPACSQSTRSPQPAPPAAVATRSFTCPLWPWPRLSLERNEIGTQGSSAKHIHSKTGRLEVIVCVCR
jgi:hypothetical protein